MLGIVILYLQWLIMVYALKGSKLAPGNTMFCLQHHFNKLFNVFIFKGQSWVVSISLVYLAIHHGYNKKIIYLLILALHDVLLSSFVSTSVTRCGILTLFFRVLSHLQVQSFLTATKNTVNQW